MKEIRHPTTQSWEYCKTSFGTQIVGPRTIIPEPEMKLTWNFYKSQGLIFRLKFQYEGAEMANIRLTYGEKSGGKSNFCTFRYSKRISIYFTHLWTIRKKLVFSKKPIFFGLYLKNPIFPTCGFSPKCVQNCSSHILNINIDRWARFWESVILTTFSWIINKHDFSHKNGCECFELLRFPTFKLKIK